MRADGNPVVRTLLLLLLGEVLLVGAILTVVSIVDLEEGSPFFPEVVILIGAVLAIVLSVSLLLRTRRLSRRGRQRNRRSSRRR
jgi:peptidoglycan/LPS O-acetylase OafA/YrhL